MRLGAMLLAVGLAVSTAVATAPPPAASQALATPSTTMTWDGSSLSGWFAPELSDAQAVTVRSYSAFRSAAYNPPKGNNLQIVRLRGGNSAIRITTRRHCTRTWRTELVAGFNRAKGQNEYRKACPKGTITRYSTGRIELPADLGIPVAGTTIDARVKLPANAVRGVRFAVWATTPDHAVDQPSGTGYCSAGQPATNLLEVDILEWYGGAGNRNKAHIGDHIGCVYPLGTRKAHVSIPGGKGWVKRWHTFGVVTGGASDRYQIDGRTKVALSYEGQPFFPSRADWVGNGKGAPTKASWDGSHSELGRYVIVLQGEVFRSAGSTRYSRPNPRKPFPAQSMLVDWVRVKTALTPAPTAGSPSPTASPSASASPLTPSVSASPHPDSSTSMTTASPGTEE